MNDSVKVGLIWGVAITLMLITFFIGLFVVITRANVEQTKQISACLDSGMQWVESSCVSK